jgi:hypothetical protein
LLVPPAARSLPANTTEPFDGEFELTALDGPEAEDEPFEED